MWKNYLILFNGLWYYIHFHFLWESEFCEVIVGKSVVANECGSLGQNNPLRLLDCSIFKLDKGMCCLLTITKSRSAEEEGVVQSEEYYETACIVLQRIDAQIINTTSIQYKYLGGDVLIECYQLYIHKSFIYITLILGILLL